MADVVAWPLGKLAVNTRTQGGPADIAACLVAKIIGRHGAAVLDIFVQQPT